MHAYIGNWGMHIGYHDINVDFIKTKGKTDVYTAITDVYSS